MFDWLDQRLAATDGATRLGNTSRATGLTVGTHG